MKRITALVTAAALMTGCISACSVNKEQVLPAEGKMHIVTTIFPEYDWVMNILGDNPAGFDVTLLLDNGADLHSFQPTAADILKITTCDLFIYVGGESDEWVDDVMKEATNKDLISVNLLETLGDSVKEEEIVEGMEGHDHDHEDHEEEDHDHDEHDHDHDHDHEDGEIEYDEHVWLSLKRSSILVSEISGAIQKIDPSNAGTYRSNTSAYLEKLNALDREYQSAVENASRNTVLFGDRFPFRYLTDDYGLQYFAAFAGCSAESEASFETITFLAKKVDEYSLTAVLTLEGTDHKIAETIIGNTASKDQKILSMDSMQSTTIADVKNGKTYYSVMEKNLEILKQALN